MKYVLGFLIALLAGFAAVPSAAQAAPSCRYAARTSYFGQIINVHPSFFTLRTNQSIGRVHVFARGARVNYGGLPLRPGVYAGVYGCRAGNGLVAEQITLAQSPQAFPGMWYGTSNDRQVIGRIDAVRGNRILIESNNGHGAVWVITRQYGFGVGQVIVANGYFSPNDRAFVASNVAPYRPY